MFHTSAQCTAPNLPLAMQRAGDVEEGSFEGTALLRPHTSAKAAPIHVYPSVTAVTLLDAGGCSKSVPLGLDEGLLISGHSASGCPGKQSSCPCTDVLKSEWQKWLLFVFYLNRGDHRNYQHK